MKKRNDFKSVLKIRVFVNSNRFQQKEIYLRTEFSGK